MPAELALTHSESTALAVVLGDDSTPDSISPEIALDALSAACKRLVAAKRMTSSLKLAIGKSLLVIQDHPELWSDRGYKTFDDFLTRGVYDLMSLPRSEAYQAKRLAEKWPHLSSDEAESITFSKLCLISKVTREDSPDSGRWLELAKSNSIDELKDVMANGGQVPREETDLSAITILCPIGLKRRWKKFTETPEVINYVGHPSAAAILDAMLGEVEVEWLQRGQIIDAALNAEAETAD